MLSYIELDQIVSYIPIDISYEDIIEKINDLKRYVIVTKNQWNSNKPLYLLKQEKLRELVGKHKFDWTEHIQETWFFVGDVDSELDRAKIARTIDSALNQVCVKTREVDEHPVIYMRLINDAEPTIWDLDFRPAINRLSPIFGIGTAVYSEKHTIYPIRCCNSCNRIFIGNRKLDICIFDRGNLN